MTPVTAPTKNSRSIVFRVFVLAFLAFSVLGLQIALPLMSYRLSGKRFDEAGFSIAPTSEMGFWKQRLCFQAFLDPREIQNPEQFLELTSATVCQDELIVLRTIPKFESDVPPQTERINLRSGRVTKSAAPIDVGQVLSDGHTLWCLPNHRQINHTENRDAFVFGSRAVKFDLSFSNKGGTVRLDEFENGRWHSKDRFLFWADYNLEFDVDSVSGQLWGFRCSRCERVWYRSGIEFESETEHRRRLATLPTVEDHNVRGMSDDTVERLGLKNFFNNSVYENSVYEDKVGHWVEGNIVSILNKSFRLGPDGEPSSFIGFTWHRFAADKVFDPELVPLPVWFLRSARNAKVLLVKATNGDKYLAFHSGSAGRWTVFRWVQGSLSQIVDQRSPILGLTCLDGALLWTLLIGFPAFVLGIIAWVIQRRLATRTIASQELVSLASVGERGLARCIDLATAVPLILLSVVLCPEAMDWWEDLLDDSSELFSCFRDYPSFDWAEWRLLQMYGQQFALRFFLAPIIWPLFALAIVIAVGQLIWQARTGQTLGKWLMGIRVQRTTLRPCGLARSLLRETLLVIDSIFLLSWVPGVISILATQNSQRIGDLLADTIVVRDSRPITVKEPVQAIKHE